MTIRHRDGLAPWVISNNSEQEISELVRLSDQLYENLRKLRMDFNLVKHLKGLKLKRNPNQKLIAIKV